MDAAPIRYFIWSTLLWQGELVILERDTIEFLLQVQDMLICLRDGRAIVRQSRLLPIEGAIVETVSCQV